MNSKRWFAVIGILGALALVILGILSGGGRNTADAAAGGTAKPTAVEVATASRAPLSATVEAVGTIASEHDVMVSSETSGRVVRVLAGVGDRINAGQPLVIVDDELKAIAVEQARAQLLAAQTNTAKAQRDFARAEKLSAAGDVSETELEGMRLMYRSAQAQEKGATMGLRFAERQLADTRIKAPVTGSVASRLVQVGEMVNPGTKIANIVDGASLKITLSIAEEEIGKIQMGQRATFRIDSSPGKIFAGTVAAIGNKSESPNGHTYPVEVRVGKDSQLKIGMFARVAIVTRSAGDALVISRDALIGESNDPVVFVVESGIARRRAVTLGLSDGDRYEVTKGLREGDQVVSFGHKGLKDGDRVQVIAPRGS